MTITERMPGRVSVVSLKGNLLGEPEITDLRGTIYRLVERNEKRVVLDLDGLKVINSTGLGAFISALATLRRRGGDLCLARLTDKAHALLTITQLFKVFKVYDSVERAVAAFER